jgi:hypothetical protein
MVADNDDDGATINPLPQDKCKTATISVPKEEGHCSCKWQRLPTENKLVVLSHNKFASL